MVEINTTEFLIGAPEGNKAQKIIKLLTVFKTEKLIKEEILSSPDYKQYESLDSLLNTFQEK